LVNLRMAYRRPLTASMVLILISVALCTPWPTTGAGRTVFVMFTFDTEDFLTPETDSVVGALAETLGDHGVRGEFYMVAEKARALAERLPEAVRAISGAHTLGYHQNGHSVHPTIAEYSDGKPWRMAVETARHYETRRINIYTGELNMNETGGIELVNRIFGKRPISFRPPGYVWSAPSLYALRELGIKASSVSSSFWKITGFPLNWYLGLVQVPMADLYLDDYLVQGDLSHLKLQFERLYEDRRENGGLIVLGNHPCRLVTRAFWDSNYYFGQNPGNASAIELPPLYEKEITDQALQCFEDFVEYVIRRSDVEVVTSEDFLGKAGEFEPPQVLSYDDLSLVAAKLLEAWMEGPPDYVELHEGKHLSLVEAFVALALALNECMESGVLPVIVDLSKPWISKVIGPTSIVWTSFTEASVEINALKSAIPELLEQVMLSLEIPSAITIGDLSVGAADLLYTMAQMVQAASQGRNITQSWGIQDFSELPASSTKIEISYDWACLPRGVNYTVQVELARLQAWTLKPIPILPPSANQQPPVELVVGLCLAAGIFTALVVILLWKKAHVRKRWYGTER